MSALQLFRTAAEGSLKWWGEADWPDGVEALMSLTTQHSRERKLCYQLRGPKVATDGRS